MSHLVSLLSGVLGKHQNKLASATLLTEGNRHRCFRVKFVLDLFCFGALQSFSTGLIRRKYSET